MQLSVSTIQFASEAAFIRGYNTTIGFNFTLTNLETNLAVDAGVNNTANYDVTVLTAHPAQPANRRRRDISADLDTIVTQSSQFPDDQLAQRLDYGSEITVTGEVRICYRYYRVCYEKASKLKLNSTLEEVIFAP